MSSGGTKMVAKPKDGAFGLRLCVPGPGDPVMGAHSARSHRTNCSMASKTMKFELVGRRRDAPTAINPGSSRVSTPPYRNPGYKPSDDAYLSHQRPVTPNRQRALTRAVQIYTLKIRLGDAGFNPSLAVIRVPAHRETQASRRRMSPAARFGTVRASGTVYCHKVASSWRQR